MNRLLRLLLTATIGFVGLVAGFGVTILVVASRAPEDATINVGFPLFIGFVTGTAFAFGADKVLTRAKRKENDQ